MTAGNLWILILLWIAAGPAAVRERRQAFGVAGLPLTVKRRVEANAPVPQSR